MLEAIAVITTEVQVTIANEATDGATETNDAKSKAIANPSLRKVKYDTDIITNRSNPHFGSTTIVGNITRTEAKVKATASAL